VTKYNFGTKEEWRVPREAAVLSGYVEHRPDASVEVPVAKGFLQRGKSRLSGAVANRDVIQLPLIVQCGRYFLNIGIRGPYQMESSEQNTDMWVYFGRSFEDLLHARVRTSGYNHQALRAANRQRNFTKFEGPGDLGDGRDNKNTRFDLGR